MSAQPTCLAADSVRRAIQPTLSLLLWVTAIGGFFVEGRLASAQDAKPEDQAVRQIYLDKCSGCHGARGEGTSEYSKPLVGDRSLDELTELIDKTMPKDAASECVGAEARQVATYIYHAFYSRTAQARNQPLRVELARLTVRQLRNSVADLIGSFRPESRSVEMGGLRGEYFRSRRMRGDDRVMERIDPVVDLNFKDGSPDDEKIEAKEFTARWQGSVFAPETGPYEFIVRTENGARLWVNRQSRPLIDVWVKSGTDTEYRESIWLLGGRVYPLRLEFLKAKEKTSSIALAWRLPHQADEVIPARRLSPARVAETYASDIPFPPDDRSTGFERGTSVSKAWDQAVAESALAAANYVVENLRDLSGVSDSDDQRSERVRDFCRRFAERAFRRPLSDELAQRYVAKPLAEAADVPSGVRRVVLLVLMSPRFQFPDLGTGDDGYDIATRLSTVLWDSIPDAALMEAAASGKLTGREQAYAQAERMIADPRATSKLREFLLQWLKVDLVPDLSKDPKLFPDFGAEAASDLRTSLDLFLTDILASDNADFRQLLLADSVYLNGRLAKLYGVDLPGDATFQKVPLDTGQRMGVLTHPYLLADFAYTGTSSPIHRGVFISRSLLGRFLRPPPEAVAPLAVDLHADLTTRERVALQTKPEACQACHSLINPLGFTLEHFDAVGRYRQEEQGRPIDARGAYRSRTGKTIEFAGAPELARFLADSDETHAAVVEQLFQYLVKQPIRAFGPNTHHELTRSLVKHNFNIRRLAVEIATTAAFRPTVPARSP